MRTGAQHTSPHPPLAVALQCAAALFPSACSYPGGFFPNRSFVVESVAMLTPYITPLSVSATAPHARKNPNTHTHHSSHPATHRPPTPREDEHTCATRTTAATT